MKQIKLLAISLFALFNFTAVMLPVKAYAEPCQPKTSFLGFPTWYKYLDGREDENHQGEKVCTPLIKCTDDNGDYCKKLGGDEGESLDASKIWLIGLAIVEILLRLAGILAVGFVIYGGIKYIISQGAPDKTKAAQDTIKHAVVGLIITVVATVSVNFIAKTLQ